MVAGTFLISLETVTANQGDLRTNTGQNRQNRHEA